MIHRTLTGAFCTQSRVWNRPVKVTGCKPKQEVGMKQDYYLLHDTHGKGHVFQQFNRGASYVGLRR